jgi:hypothetical protein
MIFLSHPTDKMNKILTLLLLFAVLSLQEDLHTVEKFRNALNSAKSRSPSGGFSFFKGKEQKIPIESENTLKYEGIPNRVRKDFNPKEKCHFI